MWVTTHLCNKTIWKAVVSSMSCSAESTKRCKLLLEENTMQCTETWRLISKNNTSGAVFTSKDKMPPLNSELCDIILTHHWQIIMLSSSVTGKTKCYSSRELVITAVIDCLTSCQHVSRIPHNTQDALVISWKYDGLDHLFRMNTKSLSSNIFSPSLFSKIPVRCGKRSVEYLLVFD